MKEELHVALRALEKNLKDIQAANETVKEIRSLAQSDIQAANKVVKKIDVELNNLEVEFNKAVSAFERSGNETIKSYGHKVGEAVKDMTKLNDSLKEHFDSNIENLSQSNRLLFQKYESAWEKHNQELNRVYLKFEELRQTIEKLKSEVTEVDFPRRLNMISESITKLEDFQEHSNQQVEKVVQKQSSNFTFLAILGGVIILLQLISLFPGPIERVINFLK